MIFIQRTVLLAVILFSTKCFLFVYIYIDLLKLKAYKLFENSDADLSWLLLLFFFFFKKPTCFTLFFLDQGQVIKYFCRISLVMYPVYYNYSNATTECQATTFVYSVKN